MVKVQGMKYSNAFVTALEKEYRANLTAIHTLNERNADIINQLVKEVHGIAIGDIVIHKENEYKISLIFQQDWCDSDRIQKPWVLAFALKKDGTWGTKPMTLYSDWEKKEE
jgi:hypothetical protein